MGAEQKRPDMVPRPLLTGLTLVPVLRRAMACPGLSALLRLRVHSRPLGQLKRRFSMRCLFVATAVVLSFAAAPASAQKMNADDIKWVNQCIDDSKGEPGATPAIARKYCMCMNEKMDDNETQSITQRLSLIHI